MAVDMRHHRISTGEVMSRKPVTRVCGTLPGPLIRASGREKLDRTPFAAERTAADETSGNFMVVSFFPDSSIGFFPAIDVIAAGDHRVRAVEEFGFDGVRLVSLQFQVE